DPGSSARPHAAHIADAYKSDLDSSKRALEIRFRRVAQGARRVPYRTSVGLTNTWQSWRDSGSLLTALWRTWWPVLSPNHGLGRARRLSKNSTSMVSSDLLGVGAGRVASVEKWVGDHLRGAGA